MTQETLDTTQTGRCPVCDWPLKASVDEGCVPGICSYRPREGSDEYRRIQQRRQELGDLDQLRAWGFDCVTPAVEPVGDGEGE